MGQNKSEQQTRDGTSNATSDATSTQTVLKTTLQQKQHLQQQQHLPPPQLNVLVVQSFAPRFDFEAILAAGGPQQHGGRRSDLVVVLQDVRFKLGQPSVRGGTRRHRKRHVRFGQIPTTNDKFMHRSFHCLHLFPDHAILSILSPVCTLSPVSPVSPLSRGGGPVATDGDVDVLTPGRDKGCFGLGPVVDDGVAVIPQQRVVVVHLRAVDGVVEQIRRGRVQFLF